MSITLYLRLAVAITNYELEDNPGSPATMIR
jgi:hypothetical protein